MADSSSKFSLPCDALSLRQMSFSIFHTSGFRSGVGAKGLPDSESVWSPTSVLDCRFFSNLSNPFSVKSSRPSFQTAHKQFDGNEVGLGIISSLVNDTKLNIDILGKFERKNIIFGPQVKPGILKFSNNNHRYLAPYLKSNSLPKNYIISLPSETIRQKFEVENFDDVSGKKDSYWECEASRNTMTSLPGTFRSSSSINTNENSNLGINELCVENTSTSLSLPPVTSRGSQADNSLQMKSNSLPISIDFSKGCIGSLSAKEIELSEDYTCIISHGPNPKRTHIFGDCILECHNNDLTEFIKKEEPAIGSEVPAFAEGSEDSEPYPSDNILSFCFSCNKKLVKEEDIYRYRGGKAFCSFDCGSEEILVGDELEKACTNSADSSPDSSYHDLFLAGLLVSK